MEAGEGRTEEIVGPGRPCEVPEALENGAAESRSSADMAPPV